jgi:general secretion pathway protein M
MALALPVGQRGRYLAAGLAVFAVVVVWLGVVAPVLDFYGTRQDEVDALRARAAREAALIEAMPGLRQRAALVSRTPTRAVLPGSSDAIAGASLQEQVQTMASGVNAQLTSIETLPGEQVGSYRRIGVRVELSAQLSVVIHLLAAIEGAQPSMLLDDVRLTGTPVGPQNAQLPLDAAFTVYAFRVGTAKEDQP